MFSLTHRQYGFSLLEVLVALLVLSVGLMGLASLQTLGLRQGHAGYLRSQATVLAGDIAERLRANREGALAGNYDIAAGAEPPDGKGITAVDLAHWKALLAAALPSGDGEVRCESATSSCQVTVRWLDSRGGGDGKQSLALRTLL